MKRIRVLDTSAILSGIPLSTDEDLLVIPAAVEKEFSPGGRDFQRFMLLKESGAEVWEASSEAMQKVRKTAKMTGDLSRLSEVDIAVIAVAVDSQNQGEVVVFSDDYSIQNVLSELQINFQGIAQKGITKKFKWSFRCVGCGRRFSEELKCCPVCGADLVTTVKRSRHR